MQFCRDILMGNYRENKYIRIHYRIQECHTLTTYDIFQNQSNYPNVCLLLDTVHRADHFITVCVKCIFDSNF